MKLRLFVYALTLLSLPLVGIGLARPLSSLLAPTAVRTVAEPKTVVFATWRSGNAETESAQLKLDIDSAFKIDDWTPKTSGVFPSKTNPLVTVTANDGKSFSWTSTVPVLAVIVKGGPGAQVYYYNGATSGTGLTPPVNPKNDQVYGISHVTFCFGKPKPDVCYEPVTGFAFEPWYVGNEETGPYYEPYWLEHKGFARGSDCDPINLVTFDGKIVGRVYLSAPDVDGLVEITITLNDEDYRFADVTKNVKIETYKFFGGKLTEAEINASTYQVKADPTKTTVTVTLPYSCIYTVFVHLERKIPCP